MKFITNVDLEIDTDYLIQEMKLKLNEVDYVEVTTESVEINWECEFEYRNWGVKDLNLSIDDIIFEIEYIVYSKDGSSKENYYTFEIGHGELMVENFGGIPIMPQSLE